MRIAKEIGATPAQVALSWVTNQPTVVSPIVGARTVKHLIENLGAVDLRLASDAAAALSRASLPKAGGHPYGAFGSGQRSRTIDGSPTLQAVVGKGSDAPLGRH